MSGRCPTEYGLAPLHLRDKFDLFFFLADQMESHSLHLFLSHCQHGDSLTSPDQAPEDGHRREGSDAARDPEHSGQPGKHPSAILRSSNGVDNGPRGVGACGRCQC